WHDRATSFSGFALLSWTGLAFTGEQVGEVQGRSVTPDFFGVVGATPLLGRTFNAEESRPNSPRVIVLSEALWRRRFGADRAIVERAVPVAGGTARVVGVMPASFRPMPLGHEQYWEPMRLDWSNRAFTGRYAMALGRLKDGVTVERAQTEMSRIARQLESDNPDFDTGWGATVVPLMEQVVGGSRRTILIVLGAVSLVLLIACANVAPTRTTAGVPAVRLRGALVIAQMSLAIVLLVGAGLLVRSLRRLIAVDPGFDPVNLSAVTITLPPPAYPDSLRRVAFYERLLERVRTMPGVQSAGIISWLPITPSNASTPLTVVGRPEPSLGPASAAAFRLVDPGYFAAMRIPLKRGRSLAPSDRIGSAPVAVISEAMARKLWPGEDPIGQHVKVEWWHPTASVESVGVLADSRHDGLDAEFAPTLFYPFAQETRQIRMSLVLPTTPPPATLTSMVRAAVSEMDQGVPVADAVTMYDHIAETMADRRYPAFVLGLFAVLALALAAVGIYGVLSYTVGQRTREIGVRVALGARPVDVLRTVLGGGLRLTLIGVALGGMAAGLAAGALGKLLYGVQPLDPVTFAIVPLVLVGVALLAMAAPARRATRVDPMVALRYE